MNYSIKNRREFRVGDLVQHITSRKSVGIILSLYVVGSLQWAHVFWSDISLFSDDTANDICHFEVETGAMYDQNGSVFSSVTHHNVGDVVLDIGGVIDTSYMNMTHFDLQDFITRSMVIVTSLFRSCDCPNDDVRIVKGAICTCHYEIYSARNAKKIMRNVPSRYLLTLDEALEYLAAYRQHNHIRQTV